MELDRQRGEVTARYHVRSITAYVRQKATPDPVVGVVSPWFPVTPWFPGKIKSVFL